MISRADNPQSVAAAPVAAQRLPWQTLLFVFGVFYLATPLSPTFSMSDLANVPKIEMTDAERAEFNASSTEQGNLGRRLGMFALMGVGCLWVARGSTRLRVRGLLGWSIVFFLAWCLATLIWSVDLGMTMRKLFVLGCMCVGALGLARQYSLRLLAELTFSCAALLLLIGLGAEVAMGTFKPWEGDYRFAGLTWPAFSAWTLSLLILAAPLLWADSRRRGWLAAIVAASVVALLLTKTRASFAALAVALLVYAGLTWTARQKLAACLVGATALVGGLFVGEFVAGEKMQREIVYALNMGREASLEGVSGRANLWADLMVFIERRPLIGYGYDSFWTPDHLLEIGESNWGAPDAHNGYINLTLGVGLLGTISYIGVLLVGTAVAVARYWKSHDRGDLFAGCAILVLGINAIFVSTQLAPALYSFLTMALLARLAFVDDAPAPVPAPSPAVLHETLLRRAMTAPFPTPR